jgi:hypothetical protein
MIRVRVPFIALAAIALVTACGNDPVADDARDSAALPTINEPTAKPYGAPPADAAPATAPDRDAASAQIPAALHGRWGLTPMDCTTKKGDAKGLLVVSADDLRFYESRAVPAADVAADSNSIQGDFTFTGEGQTWMKYQALRVKGRDLVRTESNPMASFSYAKCD